jgi:DNA-binding MarR family transcriptional regulator
VRALNPADRRGSLVRLTAAGLEVMDRAMSDHVDAEHRLVAGLDETERAHLGRLLRKLLLSLDGG